MRSTIILMAVIRASGRHGSGLICPISKLYATEIGSQPITSLRPMEPKTFVGRARPRSLCGPVAMDLGCNADRVVRIQRDVGIDGMDHYFVVFQSPISATNSPTQKTSDCALHQFVRLRFGKREGKFT